jgi:hypothetical protein
MQPLNDTVEPVKPAAPVTVVKSDFEWGVSTEVMKGDIAN